MKTITKANSLSQIQEGDTIRWTDGFGTLVSERVFRDAKRKSLVVRGATARSENISVQYLLNRVGQLAVVRD